jgi:hypothetical protein
VKTLEVILALSAEQVAGPRTPGRASGEIGHYDSQRGCVQLGDREYEQIRGARESEPRQIGLAETTGYSGE